MCSNGAKDCSIIHPVFVESTTLNTTNPSGEFGITRCHSFSLDSCFNLDMVDNRESAYCILPFLDFL